MNKTPTARKSLSVTLDLPILLVALAISIYATVTGLKGVREKFFSAPSEVKPPASNR